MSLLLAVGKRFKHLKEESYHKIPYHDLSFLCRRTPQQTLRKHHNLKASRANIIIIIFIIIIIIIIAFSW
jgi:hypothetical protein